MAEVDDRVVSLSFESSKFQAGVSSAMGALNKLKGALGFKGAAKGLDDINASASRFSLGRMANQVSSATHGFSVMRTAGLIAFADIVRRATNAGLHFAAAFTIDPIKEGFKSYETQINAVQTIMANTGLKGSKGLAQVNTVLGQMQTYANKTVYSFADMAKNIGTFTAAGVDLKTSEQSIKGIANLAALSGSNSEQASTAMYQLSQAIAAGQVHLQDWNSVVNAGMGGKVFQNALVQTAQAMGTLSKGAVKSVGPMHTLTVNGEAFRNSLTPKPGQKSWLTSGVLTTALSSFTGDLSKAQLKAKGFSDAQIKAIQAQAKVAVNAATQIKTFSQLTQALKEEVATAYGAIFKTLFGNITGATKLFTALHNTVENALTKPLYNFNHLLEGAVKLGARADILKGFKNIFAGLKSVITPIKEAFRDIFPPTTARTLANMAKSFEQFTSHLKISSKTADELRRTFRGVFAVLDIGRQIVVGVFHVFASLLGSVTKTSGGFLGITARIGDFLTGVDKALKKGHGLATFFDGLAKVIKIPAELLAGIPALLGGIFSGLGGGHGNGISKFFGSMGDGADAFQKKISGVGAKIASVFHNIGHAIGQALHGVDWGSALSAINVGLLGGIVLMLRKFVKKGFSINIAKGLFGSITESFEQLTGSLKAMQQNIKAHTLETIAIAVGVLTASIVALSFIKGENLKKSLEAVGVAFAELLGAMKILTVIGEGAGFIKIPVIAASLILLGVAVDTLTVAVFALSRMSWAQLAKGLTGVAVLLSSITVVAEPLGAAAPGMIRAGIGITAMAVGINVMALAVRQLGSLDLASEAKGIAGVAAVMIVVAEAAHLFPKNMVAIGAGVIVIAAGMKIMASAVGSFGSMNLATLAKGIGGVALSIASIAGAMHLMPPGLAAQAVGLGLVALSLGKIVAAVGALGGLSVAGLAKGLIGLGGAIAILAVGVDAMTGTASGAASLVLVAGAIAILVPAVKALGGMDLFTIAKGLGALAATFAVIGVAANFLDGVALTLIGFGAAIVLAGVGFAAFGAGVDLIAHGIATMAMVAPKGFAVVVAAVTSLAKTIPTVLANIGKGIVGMASSIAKGGPALVVALAKIIGDILQAIIIDVPKFGQAMGVIIQTLLRVIRNNAPQILREGIRLLEQLLSGIKKNISQITSAALDIVIRFLNAIASKGSQVVRAGANVIVKLLDGIANNIGRVTEAGVHVLSSIIIGFGRNLRSAVTAGGKAVANIITGITDAMGRVISAGASLLIALVSGISRNFGRMVTAGAQAMGNFIGALARASIKLVNAGAQAILTFLNGVRGAINKYEPQLISAGIGIGGAIISGMVKGIAGSAWRLAGELGSVAKSIPGKIGHLLGIGSPSKVMAKQGGYIVDGLALGIAKNTGALDAMGILAKGLINNFKSIFQIQSPSKVMMELGKYVNQGFAQGLRGSIDDITGAFNDFNDKLSTAIDTAKSAISDAQASMEGATKRQKTKYRQTIRDNQDLLNELLKTQTTFNKGTAANRKKLEDDARAYDALSQKLQDAQQKLQDAQQAEADAVRGYKDTFSQLPDLQTDDPTKELTNYTGDLQTEVANLKAYADVLNQLRAMGLDNDTYMKLLNDGPQDLAFAQELLAGGKGAVDQVNSLDSQLDSSAKALADKAGKDLYGAGVDAAQKVVDGLVLDEKKLAYKMDVLATKITNALNKSLGTGVKAAQKKAKPVGVFAGQSVADGVAEGINNHAGVAYDAVSTLADGMINTLKRKLKIKSPSEVFAGLGAFSAQGFVSGLGSSQSIVSDAATNVGDTAVQAMRDSLSKASDVIMEKVDPNPVITPVLDLSQVHESAKKLNNMSMTTSVTATSSKGQAAEISRLALATVQQPPAEPPSKVLSFTQNLSSPKALSAIEIYRQTRNQLSQAQKMLETG